MTENLRSGVNGKVREVIQQSVARIAVGVDGSPTIGARLGVLLRAEGTVSPTGGTREGRRAIQKTISPESGRQWEVTNPTDR